MPGGSICHWWWSTGTPRVHVGTSTAVFSELCAPTPRAGERGGWWAALLLCRTPGAWSGSCLLTCVAPAAGRKDVCTHVHTGTSVQFERRRSVSSPGFCLGTALLDLSSVLHSQLAEEHMRSLGGVRHLYKQDCRMMLVHRLGWVTSGYLWLAELHRFQFRHRGVLPAWAALGPGFCLGVKEHCTLLPLDRENKTFS